MNKNSAKKILAIAATVMATLALAGCFNLGGGTATPAPADDRSKIYENGEFSIKIPKEWDILERDDFTSEVPLETAVVFRNNVKNETFTANVVIVKNFLQTPVPTLEYAKMVNNRQSSGLFAFKETRKDEAKISIGGKDEDTFFVGFEAKKGTDEKLVRYLQIYGVKNNDAYIVTGAFSPQENENTAKTIEDIVKSFNLK